MGARLQVHRTSVTNIVDQLERSGYVQRVPHDVDRRTVLASITAEGRRVAEAATRELNAASFGTAPLEADDLEALSAVLLRLRLEAGDFEV
jgi:DNA-binding MarR family transcriptional regulator